MTESTVSDNSSSILNLDDLKFILGNRWVEGEDEHAARYIELALATLRTRFKKLGKNLYEEIESGEVERIYVQEVVANMVYRALEDARNAGAEAGDFSQMSESVGPYSFSISKPTNNNFFLRKDEEKLLGLGAGMKVINLIGRR